MATELPAPSIQATAPPTPESPPAWTLKETLTHFDDWIAHARGEGAIHVAVPIWAAERVIRALREAMAKS